MNRETYLSSSPEATEQIARAELRKRWDEGAIQRLSQEAHLDVLEGAMAADEKGDEETFQEELQVALLLRPYAYGFGTPDSDPDSDVDRSIEGIEGIDEAGVYIVYVNVEGHEVYPVLLEVREDGYAYVVNHDHSPAEEEVEGYLVEHSPTFEGDLELKEMTLEEQVEIWSRYDYLFGDGDNPFEMEQ